MASIMKRGNTYSVRYNYKDHAGKPCKGWETFKTKAEAQERKITVEKELLDGTFLVPDTMTVEEMLYKWIPIQSSKHKWSPKTYTQSVAMVQNLIVPYIGKRKVQDLRTYDIEQFYATLSQTPCGQYVHGEMYRFFRKRISEFKLKEDNTMRINGFSGTNTQTGTMGMTQGNDSVSKNIQNQIANAQQKLQDLSSNEEMSLEDKMKKRQEIQQEINNLNQQLRQHQIEQRNKQQSKNSSSMDDMVAVLTAD